MFERFSDNARKAMALANQEARQAGHDFVRPECLLVAISRAGPSIASDILAELHLDTEQLREQAKALPTPVADGNQEAKQVVMDAIAFVRACGDRATEPEHLLWALLRQPEGVVPRIFRTLGIDATAVSLRIISKMEENPQLDLWIALWNRVPVGRREEAMTLVKALVEKK